LEEFVPQIIKLGVPLSNTHGSTLMTISLKFLTFQLSTYMQSLDCDVPYYKGPQVSSYAHPAAVYNYMIFNIYTLCPARFVLPVFPIRIVPQCDRTIWY
jgi:hypothetical protein